MMSGYTVCPNPKCKKFLFEGDIRRGKEGKKICRWCEEELEPEKSKKIKVT